MSTPSNPNQDLMDSFVQKLMEQKKFASQDPDVLAEIKKDLLKRVEYHINAGLLAALPPEHLKEFDELLANGSDEAVQSFLKRYIPDFEATVADILLDFKALYLGA